MLTKDHVRDIFNRVRSFASTPDVELLIDGGRSALTRFANNTILQNVSEEDYSISARVQFGGRTARASTNKLDPESLRRCVHAAESLAQVQEEDADLMPMYKADGTGMQVAPSRYFAETAAFGPGERAEIVSRMVDVAKRQNLNAAGVFAISDHLEAMVNSHGVERWHKQTGAETSITMQAANSSGWQKANAPDVRELDPVRLAEIAAEKARGSADPMEVPAGKYTVILEPAAVLDIVGFMFWDFSGMALLDQRSFLNDRIGKPLFGENINIRDDAHHPLQAGAPFDGEGLERQTLELVSNGVVNQIAISRSTAKRIANSEFASQVKNPHPTGHGFPLPNEMGEAPMNVVFEIRDGQPTKSVEQMVAETERGILVTRLWYIREVDPYEKIVTGMTRDGTFLVENGRVKHGVRNFRFNESLIHMLSNVEAMGTPVRASGEESFDMVVPAMKIREFNFTEVTKF